jgi:cation-transporting ATPase 13A2
MLIREGRAALVTSFSCFKYMATYSLVQFTSVSLLYSLNGNIGDFQFLFVDLGIIIPLAATMARSEANLSLDAKPPTSRLVSKRVLVSLIGQVVIQVAFQFWIFLWVRRQDWYAY